ncbi:HAMP domain-containing sensor histidine kinase [Gallaecimonas kandeliae]|uniref:ATP-binding protein n=1 Tax=Gallaecimonas kandeliae TaxID=3029055 RepID=UPI002647E23E|nr:HAMP domain-containing sensor histidine kinase [Gallaecimonas kandeliae]WKE65293.1 HAMP domain-containing sensor histidine kinase [Gallaecimonas kandeliae]
MKRLFFSLYGLLLLALLLLGYGLDQLWQRFNAEPARATASQRQLVALLDAELASRPRAQWAQYLAKHQVKGQLIDPKDIGINQPLGPDEILPLTQGNQDYLLTPIGQGYLLLGPYQRPPEPGSYGFAATFFVLLALLVLLWLWPLVRELTALKAATLEFGKGNWQKRLAVRPRDRLGDLAQSFNLMAARIEGLLADQALMTRAVSHDLRTPLARLRFALAMNGQGPYDGQIKEDLEYLEQIVSHWSEFHELETVEVIDKEPLALLPLLERLATRQVALQGPFPEALNADPHLLTRCLQNLLDNAGRYAKAQIRVGWRGDALVVEDDGPGLSDEDKQKATQLFYRGDKARGQDPVPHLGLGLAMCSRIMVLHGGRLTLDDSPLGGARISLHFPRDRK